MHTLHTTKAFVLQRYPHGESNYTYKLLTQKLGLLYAHGQGVRELKNRNKYALRVGQLSQITLVKGREVWRITGAQNYNAWKSVSEIPLYVRKILRFVGKMLAVEDESEKIFTIVEECFLESSKNKEETGVLLEALTMFRLMDAFGFVARPIEEKSIAQFLEYEPVSKDLLKRASKHKQTLITRVNNALEEAK
jgi:recombinational DNA repair protein (RecF pathway)